MPAAALDAMTPDSVRADVAWTDEAREAFLDLLRSGAGRGAALETLDRIGLLERYLPAWTDVRCRPQRDPYPPVHRRRAPAGGLAAAAALLDEPGGDPLAAEAAVGRERPRRTAARRAAPRHRQDRGGRPRRGRRRIASRTLERMGVAGTDRRSCPVPRVGAPAAVRHGDAARPGRRGPRRGVAARVGTTGRLAALTCSRSRTRRPPGRSPGPPGAPRSSASSSRRSGTSSSAATSDPAPPNGSPDRADAIRHSLAGRDRAAVERFLERMPRGYLLSVPRSGRRGSSRSSRGRWARWRCARSTSGGSRPGTYALAVGRRRPPGTPVDGWRGR